VKWAWQFDEFFMSGHTPYDILLTYKPRILVKLVRKIEKKERKKNDKLVVQYN